MIIYRLEYKVQDSSQNHVFNYEDYKKARHRFKQLVELSPTRSITLTRIAGENGIPQLIDRYTHIAGFYDRALD
ncbi:MAG: hypothetical protein J6Y78_00620 [Paludibacteraceae bacterium]|nr:hypothetical protein [Paludibacteraceae bacterium]